MIPIFQAASNLAPWLRAEPNYDPVFEATAHADEALEFLREGYDPDFVAQKARVALFELDGILRDWEPTFEADGIRGAQVRNRVKSARADLLRIPALVREQIAETEAARDRGEGVTFGEFFARGGVRAVNTAAGGLSKFGEGAGKFGPAALAVAVIGVVLVLRVT